MSQSRFSIVLVGVSALLRRPLVSRLRPAAFTARGSGGFRRSALPSVSEIAARRVDLRAHGFRFSACIASGLPSAGWPSGSRLPLFGMHRFGVTLGELVLPPSASELPSSGWFFRSAGWPSGLPFPLFGTHRFGVALGELVLPPSASAFATRRVGSAAFCFGDCRLAGWPSGLPFPLFGTHRFGVATRRVGSSVFRFGDCRSAGWASGSLLPLFGMRRSAPPRRRSEDRRSTPTRHLFHFKTLISTC